ncbi:unnamed protein product [Penicillium salamii]|uniref:Beta-lactamase-related domain-containing protein n=1 Tax=Penicillium salamii TaxID=1612424 RepID=A0A9W4N281_9EURO|nr:unnamed protein product [Penicillium salamii]
MRFCFGLGSNKTWAFEASHRTNVAFSFLKDFFIILIIAISKLPPDLLSPEPSSHIQYLRDRVDDLLLTIRTLQQIGGSVGISIGIMRQGEIVCDHHFKFADVENQRVANSFTRYPLGSLTKAFVATDLARLDAIWVGANNKVLVSKDSTVVICNELSLLSPLRSKSIYNNWMYTLVGGIIERGKTIISSINDNTDHPLHDISKILSRHTFINKSSAFDELYTLGFRKVTLPAQLKPELIFYHNGALPNYNNCFILLPSNQIAIVVLTNSISHAAEAWKGSYQTITETLEKERIPNTPEPQRHDFIGTFWHSSKAQFLEVSNEDGLLTFSINGKPTQKHVSSHYHYDSFCILPSAEERLRRGIIVYAAPAWILHFQRTSEGEVDRVIWNLDSESPHAEVFVKSEST